jgi:hypothetical protein
MKRLLILAPLVLVFSLGFGEKTKAPCKMRVANLSPDTPAVDVLVNGDVKLKDVPTKSISHYVEIPSGKHEIVIVPAGKTEPVLSELKTKFKGEKSYTLAISGLHKQNDVKMLNLTDENKTEGGKTRIRFVNLIPDAPALDVVNAKGEKLFKNMSFRKASGYETVEPGDHSFTLNEKGKKTSVFTIKDMKFDGGWNYTIFAIGEMKGKTLAAVHVVDRSMVTKTSPAVKPEVKKAEPAKKTEPVKKVEPTKKAEPSMKVEPTKKHVKPVKAEPKAKVAPKPTTQKVK